MNLCNRVYASVSLEQYTQRLAVNRFVCAKILRFASARRSMSKQQISLECGVEQKSTLMNTTRLLEALVCLHKVHFGAAFVMFNVHGCSGYCRALKAIEKTSSSLSFSACAILMSGSGQEPATRHSKAVDSTAGTSLSPCACHVQVQEAADG